MKKNINIFSTLCFAVFLISCSKTAFEPIGSEISSVSFINASPSQSPLGAQIFVDDSLQTNTLSSSIVGYLASTSYLGIKSGTHKISIENRAANPKLVYATLNPNLEAGKAYSYFMYDTLDTKGQARVLTLTDDLSLPEDGKTKVRFLNLAIDRPSFDVTLVRITAFADTSGRPAVSSVSREVAVDSVTFANQLYVGSSPDISNLSKFVSIAGSTGNPVTIQANGVANVPAANRNNRYIIKLKNPGTQTVVAQTTAVQLNAGRIYTIIARGNAKGQALGISVITQF